MTKEECRRGLMSGKTMDDMFQFRPGQDCLIFKADRFEPGEEILYIPDIDLNDLYVDRPRMSDDDISDAVSCCYTGDDFIEACEGNVRMAEELFGWVDWEHPSSALPDLELSYKEELEYQNGGAS